MTALSIESQPFDASAEPNAAMQPLSPASVLRTSQLQLQFQQLEQQWKAVEQQLQKQPGHLRLRAPRELNPSPPARNCNRDTATTSTTATPPAQLSISDDIQAASPAPVRHHHEHGRAAAATGSAQASLAAQAKVSSQLSAARPCRSQVDQATSQPAAHSSGPTPPPAARQRAQAPLRARAATPPPAPGPLPAPPYHPPASRQGLQRRSTSPARVLRPDPDPTSQPRPPPRSAAAAAGVTPSAARRRWNNDLADVPLPAFENLGVPGTDEGGEQRKGPGPGPTQLGSTPSFTPASGSNPAAATIAPSRSRAGSNSGNAPPPTCKAPLVLVLEEAQLGETLTLRPAVLSDALTAGGEPQALPCSSDARQLSFKPDWPRTKPHTTQPLHPQPLQPTHPARPSAQPAQPQPSPSATAGSSSGGAGSSRIPSPGPSARPVAAAAETPRGASRIPASPQGSPSPTGLAKFRDLPAALPPGSGAAHSTTTLSAAGQQGGLQAKAAGLTPGAPQAGVHGLGQRQEGRGQLVQGQAGQGRGQAGAPPARRKRWGPLVDPEQDMPAPGQDQQDVAPARSTPTQPAPPPLLLHTQSQLAGGGPPAPYPQGLDPGYLRKLSALKRPQPPPLILDAPSCTSPQGQPDPAATQLPGHTLSPCTSPGPESESPGGREATSPPAVAALTNTSACPAAAPAHPPQAPSSLSLTATVAAALRCRQAEDQPLLLLARGPRASSASSRTPAPAPPLAPASQSQDTGLARHQQQQQQQGVVLDAGARLGLDIRPGTTRPAGGPCAAARVCFPFPDTSDKQGTATAAAAAAAAVGGGTAEEGWRSREEGVGEEGGRVFRSHRRRTTEEEVAAVKAAALQAGCTPARAALAALASTRPGSRGRLMPESSEASEGACSVEGTVQPWSVQGEREAGLGAGLGPGLPGGLGGLGHRELTAATLWPPPQPAGEDPVPPAGWPAAAPLLAKGSAQGLDQGQGLEGQPGRSRAAAAAVARQRSLVVMAAQALAGKEQQGSVGGARGTLGLANSQRWQRQEEGQVAEASGGEGGDAGDSSRGQGTPGMGHGFGEQQEGQQQGGGAGAGGEQEQQPGQGEDLERPGRPGSVDHSHTLQAEAGKQLGSEGGSTGQADSQGGGVKRRPKWQPLEPQALARDEGGRERPVADDGEGPLQPVMVAPGLAADPQLLAPWAKGQAGGADCRTAPGGPGAVPQGGSGWPGQPSGHGLLGLQPPHHDWHQQQCQQPQPHQQQHQHQHHYSNAYVYEQQQQQYNAVDHGAYPTPPYQQQQQQQHYYPPSDPQQQQHYQQQQQQQQVQYYHQQQQQPSAHSLIRSMSDSAPTIARHHSTAPLWQQQGQQGQQPQWPYPEQQQGNRQGQGGPPAAAPPLPFPDHLHHSGPLPPLGGPPQPPPHPGSAPSSLAGQLHDLLPGPRPPHPPPLPPSLLPAGVPGGAAGPWDHGLAAAFRNGDPQAALQPPNPYPPMYPDAWTAGQAAGQGAGQGFGGGQGWGQGMARGGRGPGGLPVAPHQAAWAGRLGQGKEQGPGQQGGAGRRQGAGGAMQEPGPGSLPDFLRISRSKFTTGWSAHPHEAAPGPLSAFADVWRHRQQQQQQGIGQGVFLTPAAVQQQQGPFLAAAAGQWPDVPGAKQSGTRSAAELLQERRLAQNAFHGQSLAEVLASAPKKELPFPKPKPGSKAPMPG